MNSKLTPAQRRNHRRARALREPLIEALEEAREVLSLCSTRRFDAPEDEEVGALGARLGYGAVMSAASKEWAKMFDGTLQSGSQHTSGPAELTVRRTIEMIDKALASVRRPAKAIPEGDK